MSDNYDDSDSPLHERVSDQITDSADAISFGEFNVISPGVHIILYGRQVSHSDG